MSNKNMIKGLLPRKFPEVKGTPALKKFPPEKFSEKFHRQMSFEYRMRKSPAWMFERLLGSF